MENQLTTEQKARVFAQYIGLDCKVLNYSSPYKITSVNETSLCVISKAWENRNNPSRYYGFGECSILLRPLSAITDEDATEVAKMHFGREHVEAYPDMHWKYREFVKSNMYDLLTGYKTSSAIWIFQFLIQRGYAVPLFIAPGHPLNGKTAIETGLAINATTL